MEFPSRDDTVVGHLYRSTLDNGPAPAVAMLGPMTYQKEQAPTQYAVRLAALGYTALVFDPRYRGESSGEPRCYENPVAKGQDLTAALDHLTADPDVDADRLAVVGICFGATHALPVVADDPRVKAVALVSGHYRDLAADLAWLGKEELDARRLRGEAALRRYEQTGEVEYLPAIDHTERREVGMPGELAWNWYQLWADRGLWENRYAVMSDAAVFTFDSITAAARLTTPCLMVHGDRGVLPDAARRHFAVVPTPDKSLIWHDHTQHLQFYDDPEVLDQATIEIVDWFARHLGPGHRS